MLISLDWLNEYVEVKGKSLEELDNALTMIGQEVEEVTKQGEGLDNVIVGQIVEFGQHPDSDKLSLCKVNIGEEDLQIVCGAKNHKNGDKVVVATIGAVLGGDFKIKKAKVRGVESFGMMCSEKELGIGEANEGIMILPEDATVGTSFKDYKELNDIIFELEITPNRPDCLSHIGIAREVAAYYGTTTKYPEIKIEEAGEKTDDNISIEIENKELCKRYSGRIIKGIKVKESPEWLKKRLQSIGLRSINNIVDITNFVMMEYNHPMHAFDYNKLDGKKIIVRNARENEKIKTLDGEERELKNKELVVADANKAVAIAGIMGGSNSEVDENTTDIMLEVAYFTPENIRKTSKSLGLSSDSSYRFERGIDITDAETIINRAAALMKELAGGEILNGIVDEVVELPKKITVELNLNKLNKFVGKEISIDKVKEILKNLELEIIESSNDVLKVQAPFFRGDIKIQVDLFEEVIRMYGFDNIEPKMPEENIQPGIICKETLETDRFKSLLKEMGLQEVINYSFIPEGAYLAIKQDIEKAIKLINPINEEMGVMRTNLIYSLLTNVKDNMNRNIGDLQIFEISKVFFKTEGELADEPIKIGFAISGKDNKTLWNSKPSLYDFYDLKGYVEQLFEKVGLNSGMFKRSENATFHPGRSADIFVGKDLIGTFGEIHPDVTENIGIKEKVYLAELDLAKILKYSKSKVKYKKVVKYPAVERDLAIVVDEDILVGDMIKDISKAGNIIENVDLFDVYRGDRVGEGLKSVAVNIILRSDKGTLQEEEIKIVMDKILKTVEKKYDGKLRS